MAEITLSGINGTSLGNGLQTLCDDSAITSEVVNLKSDSKGKFYIYIHTRKSDGLIAYVGKGTDYRAWSKSRTEYWHRVNNKHGLDVKILHYFDSEDEAFEKEKELIALYRSMNMPLVNFCDGGEGPSGRVMSEETKAKLKAANYPISDELRNRLKVKAKETQNRPEVKEKIRNKTKERWADPEYRKMMIEKLSATNLSPERSKKISEALIKSHADPEVKKRRSAALSIGKNTPEAKQRASESQRKVKSRRFICIENGMEFEALVDAEIWLKSMGKEKASLSSIWSALNGKRKRAHDFTWKYIEQRKNNG